MNQDRLQSLIRRQRPSLVGASPVVLDFMRYGMRQLPDCLTYAGPGRRASNARGIMLEPYFQTQLHSSTDPAAFAGAGGFAPVNRAAGTFTTPDGHPAIKGTTIVGTANYITASRALSASTWYYRGLVVKPPPGPVQRVIFEYLGMTGATFDLVAGTVTGGGAGWIEPLSGGFYRLHHQVQTPAAPAVSLNAYYLDAYGNAANAADYIIGEPSCVQLGGNGQGYPMAFLPNLTGATLQRANETLSLTLDQQLLQWNATGWSCVFEWENIDNRNLFSTLLWMKEPTEQTFLQLWISTSGALTLNVWKDNAQLLQTAILPAGSIRAGAINRVAFAVDATSVRACVNGGAVGQLNVATPMARLTTADLGYRGAAPYNALRGWIRRIRAWGIALPNGDLQREST